MKCYKCNATLSEHDFCNKCGTDVRIYKKIMRSSEACYNMGLERARNRDLTGAAELLRRSVKYNKHNTNARNLLGLVYFEMGEVVAALSEWVISLNLQPEKNIADTYLNKVHRDTGRLDVINQTIKKYNQTLRYAQENSEDLALIQMKKVLSLYPNLIKGHQLLALLYMKMGDYERAFKPIKKALSIDRNNPLTLKYYEEIKTTLEASGKSVNSQKIGKNKHIPDNGKLAYVSVPESSEEKQSEDYILLSTKYKESTGNGGLAILNIIIGIAIGLALAWFLILPNKLAQKDEENKIKLNEQNNLLDSKSATIANLQASITELETERDRLRASISSVEEENTVIPKYDMLLEAVSLYYSGKYLAADEQFRLINIEEITDENYIAVYEAVMAENNLCLAPMYYDEGYTKYYKNNDFVNAALWLQRSYDLNPNVQETVYFLARAYDRMDTKESEAKAAVLYQEVIDKFPDYKNVSVSKSYLKAILAG